ncbi:hypothetical protein E8E14_000397 [Neopestalotiopsis sp. 37M]|nr:hypothetical protein E8E14_000397 [Neopestalotiopsis sp. 37M]
MSTDAELDAQVRNAMNDIEPGFGNRLQPTDQPISREISRLLINKDYQPPVSLAYVISAVAWATYKKHGGRLEIPVDLPAQDIPPYFEQFDMHWYMHHVFGQEEMHGSIATDLDELIIMVINDWMPGFEADYREKSVAAAINFLTDRLSRFVNLVVMEKKHRIRIILEYYTRRSNKQKREIAELKREIKQLKDKPKSSDFDSVELKSKDDCDTPQQVVTAMEVDNGEEVNDMIIVDHE